VKTLDMRGQPCPMPVVSARKALAEPGTTGVVVLVDNAAATQNLEKMARGTGHAFSCEQDGDTYKVGIAKGASAIEFTREPASPATAAREKDSSRGPVVLITADSMGRGSDELGQLLVKGFVFSLAQLTPPPEAVIFLNSGARLTAQGSSAVGDLKQLEENGAGVYTCGTCANYYKTVETLAVGSIVDMMAITNLLASASAVITI